MFATERLNLGSSIRNNKEAIEKIKQNTRNYAKRQITWNKKYSDAKKIDMSKNVTDNINKILQK